MTTPTTVLELRSVRGTGGGPEKTIMLGAAQADRSRFNVIVCYLRDRRDDVFRLDERAARLGIDYVELYERHSFDPGLWRQLRQLVHDRSVDIVHAHEYKTDLLAYWLGKRTGVIPLATAHAWTGNTARERYVYYPVDKRLLARFPRVIAVSTEIKEELVRHGARPDRVPVILNSIDAGVFRRDPARRDAIRAQLGFTSGEFVAGAVGRVEHQKRFDLLLLAVAQLAPRHPSLRLAIAGDGSLRETLVENAAHLGIADRTRFLGHRDDIVDLHHAFDLFVQSSEYEGTPNAVLEAMAMETPLVATDVGGTRELAAPEEHGWIVPKNDLAALTSAMEHAIADAGLRRQRALAARQRVERDLTFAARTRRLESIYDELRMERRRA